MEELLHTIPIGTKLRCSDRFTIVDQGHLITLVRCEYFVPHLNSNVTLNLPEYIGILYTQVVGDTTVKIFELVVPYSIEVDELNWIYCVAEEE
jgi:hypothetical protein